MKFFTRESQASPPPPRTMFTMEITITKKSEFTRVPDYYNVL